MIEQASLVLGNGNWAVKSDSLLGYKINGGKYYPREFTFTRATTGTRVNEAGLVELVPYNLLSYSEEMSTSPWALVRSTVNTNATTAPNGTLTADELIANVTGSNGSWTRQTISAINGSFNLSVYAKQGTSPFLYVRLDGLGGVIFDLSNGTIKSSSAGIVGVITTDVNGWYKCSISGTATGQTLALFIVGNASMNLSTWFSTNGDSVYLWGAQLVEGSSALDYLPTTDRLDIARIDYSTGEPALLLEPQRTNLVTYSSSFDNAAWVVQFATITANDATAPDGTMTADRLNVLTNGYAGVYQSGNSALNKYTSSIFAKKGTKDWLYFVNASGTLVVAWFNISNGTLGTIINGTATIEDFGNGWYRCNYSDASNIANSFFQIGFSDADNSFTPSSNGFAYIWGAQREVGTYPTSYIPTTSASVTRNADFALISNASNLIGQTEGTMFIEFTRENNSVGTFSISANNVGTRIYIGTDATGLICQVRNGYVQQAYFSTAQIEGTKYKCAIAYATNDFVLYMNGTQIGTDTSGTVPACNTIRTDDAGGANLNQPLNQAILFPTRLTNAELATLTTI